MKKQLLILFTVFLSSISFGQENTWEKKADFAGLKRMRAVGIAIGDYGYVGTGIDTAEQTHNDWWQYDPVLDSWTQVADVPGPLRRSAIAFVIDDKGYVGCGIDSAEADLGLKLFDFHEYDPIANSWTEKAPYPGGEGIGIYQAAGVAVNGKGYVACGKVGPDDYLQEFWEYTPETDSWMARPPFPGGDRHKLSAFGVEGKAYVGMGTDHDHLRKDWWAYDPSTLSWTEVASLPGTERTSASTFVIQSRAYVVFGTNGGVLDELWEYNPFSDSWNVKSSFGGSARRDGIAFTIGDTAYAGLGKGLSGKKQSFYRYYPAGPVSVEENQSDLFKIYPNPVQESSVIQFSTLEEGNMAIYDMNGKLLYQNSFAAQTVPLAIDNLNSGTYLVSITLKNSQQTAQQLITLP